ncbi:MAG: serine hydrolase domain-containing protein [Pseudomonadota bacterium]
MDNDIGRWLSEKHVPGLAACIVSDRHIVWARGYGAANISKGIPFTPDRTIFQIASVTKTITALATMQLRDMGRIALDDDIEDFLGFELRNPQFPDEEITFADLLTHSAGIRDNENLYSLYAPGDPTVSLKHVVHAYFRRGGEFWTEDNFYDNPPGETRLYSNMGFALLGHLIEVVSRMPLQDYLKRFVYGPLGMLETSFYLSQLPKDMHASPYTFAPVSRALLIPGDGDGNLLPKGTSPKAGYNEHALYSFPTLADGMARTSATQLANFLICLMNGGRFNGSKILKDGTVDEMLTEDRGGLGLARVGDYWGHDGSDPGCAAEMFFNPRTKVGFVAVANADVNLGDIRELLIDRAEQYHRHAKRSG